MRWFAPLLLLLAAGCDNGHPPPRPMQKSAQPIPITRPAAVNDVNELNAAQSAPDDLPPRDDPGVAGLSPAQRRAYELGYRDCSHGRYAPDNHLEAYRIGCGAAHERIEGGRPQG